MTPSTAHEEHHIEYSRDELERRDVSIATYSH